MNYLVLVLFATLLAATNPASNTKHHIESCAPPPIATCYGYNPCNACKNCNYCKHCNSGGTCGVCTPSKNTNPKKLEQKSTTIKPLNSGQCKAITKSGTRCSRAAKSNGYCWQH